MRWSVFRHAEFPERFIEMFVVPSWDEHLRQQARRTVADASLHDRVRAFLRDEIQPDVEHFVTPPRLPRRPDQHLS
jgi:Transmembrane secretion effector